MKKTFPAAVQVALPIDYDFDVTNTGSVNLVDVDVSDPTVGFDNNPNISLAPAGTKHYDAQMTKNTPQVINNTVSASGDFGSSTVFATVNDSASCTTHVVDARISIVHSAVNQVNTAHTFVVTVEKNDGTGWAAASGVVVTPSETGVGSITNETCTAGTDASGQCKVTVNSSSPGSSTVNASATVTVLGVPIDVATNGYGAFTVSNTKTWVAGSLAWLKKDNFGNPLGGATFQVCRTLDRFGAAITPPECVTVLDNSAPDQDPNAGGFLLTNLGLGTYTIKETVPPPGYNGDSYVETIVLTLADPNKSATHIWINIPNQGCTPDFWQGGAGAPLWDQVNDPQWIYNGTNPYIHTTLFNAFFNVVTDSRLNGYTMYQLVSSGGGSDPAVKAARDMVAAYLNESAFPATFPAPSLADLKTMWYNAVTGGDSALDAFHLLVSQWNSPAPPGFCPLP